MSGFSLRGAGRLWAGVCMTAVLGLGLAPLAAQAQVNAQDVIVPSNIGNQMTATVSLDYLRTSAAPGTITVALPPTLGVNPPALPAGCVQVAATVQCAVPAGATGAQGFIDFTVRGLSVGSYLLSAVGTGQVAPATSNGSVRESGDLTVVKTRTAPAGVPITGQAITFRLQPNTVGDAIPAGSAVSITDQLPGGATDFNATGAVVSPAGAASCSINNPSRSVTCNFNGPLSAAAFSAVTIDITGSSANSGNFVNNANISTNTTVGAPYFDRNSGNNTTSVSYTVTPGADIVPTGSSYPATTLVATTQTLNLVFQNDGPSNVPAGGTVVGTVPAGFTVGTLPVGCGYAAPLITCTAGAVTNGANQTFAIPLGNPAAATSGNITVTVAAPAGFADANLGNNTVLLPYSIVPPTGDLALTKAKTAGPLPEGAAIVNTISVSNADISTVTFTAAGGLNPLRVIDDMLNEEVYVSASAGWTCTNTAGVPSATQHRVICQRTAAGTLAPGANFPLTINTQVTTTIGANPVNLVNTACTGKQALNLLGLADANGSQPRDPNTANDCQSQGVIGTPVTSGEAQVGLIKESSTDGVTWVDAPASGPTIVASNEFAWWRIRVTTPALAQNAAQQTIPGLTLTDNLPGILSLAAAGPTPAHVTPPITITQVVTGAGAGGSCPATLAAGSGNLSCAFSNVQPGTTITLVVQVKRPFDAGQLDNTASLSSGNAILSGTTSDAARLIVEPRVDPAVTSKIISPANSASEPRVGQTVSFTITMRNHGVNTIPSGGMTLSDTLNPAKYAISSVSGVNLNCSFVAATGVVTCPTTNDVVRADVRTAVIVARLIKPAGPLLNPVYANEINTATVTLSAGLCEWKEETSTNALLSTACNDTNSRSNNQGTVLFDIKQPAIDLQVSKSRITPPGGRYAYGDTLKYLVRMQNIGPSRAENVVLADYLTIPAGFSFGSTTATLVNNAAADTGFVLDTSKTNATVSCSGSSTTSIGCRLSSVAADNFLDNGREVNFVLEVAYTGASPSVSTFSNQVVICAAETTLFEARGACTTATQIITPGDNNNTASANDTVFPKADLSIAKQTITPTPAYVNQAIQYRLTVRNDGPAQLAQIRVADVLPANFEYVTSTVALGPFVTQAPSTTTAANMACVPTPAAITAAGQSQTLNCTIDAVGGPFPGSTNAGNTITILVTAKAKVPYFTGPYATNLVNTVTVTPGLDLAGDPLAVDSNPANNTATANIQLTRSSIGGRVYGDTNLNRAPDGPDTSQPNVPITITGTDLFGNSITATTTTALNGSYSFDLPPGTYNITKGPDPSGLLDFTSNVPGTVPFGTTGGPVSVGTAASTASGSPTAANQSTGIRLAAGDAATGYNFGEVSGNASISGRVYVDTNDDGFFTGVDTAIPGVTVTLTGLDANGTSVSRSTLTNALGAYSFPGLFPGNYTVTEPNQPTTANGATLPLGFASTINGKTTLGTGATSQGAATTVTVVPSAFTGIQLGNGQASIDNNFGELLPSAISGRVWQDATASNNGLYNPPGDTPLPGVQLTLTGTNDIGQVVNVSVTTGASGTYSFTNLRPGTYTVTEPAQPYSTANGITTAGPVPNGGTPGTASPVAVLPSSIANIVLPRATTSPDNNFAEIFSAPPVTPSDASIAGRVWLDNNNNGVIDGTEAGIGGVTIVLTGIDAQGNTVNRSVVTGPDGSYLFAGLSPGAYQVTEPNQPATANGATLPPGIATTANGITVPGTGAIAQGTATLPSIVPSSIGTIVLGAGNASVNNNFGEYPPSTISGFVYFDSNGNGVRDGADKPIANIPITLSGTDDQGKPVSATVNTDAAGRYEFTGLRPGTYTVTEPTQPPGTDNAETNPGTINNGGTPGKATPRTTVPSSISGIRILTGGTVSPDNNFGEAGGSPDVVVTKLARQTFFTENNTGSYDISVRNAGVLPTTGEYVVYDVLPRNSPQAWRIESASGAGWSCSVAADGLSLACTSSVVLAAGAVNPSPIEVRVSIAEGAKAQAPLRNFTLVRGGGESPANDPFPGRPISPGSAGAPSDGDLRGLVPSAPPCVDQPASASQNFCVRETPIRFSVAIGGRVWLDGQGPRNTYDPSDKNYPGWRVIIVDPALYDANGKGIPPGAIVRTTTTGADGSYIVGNLIPGKPYYVFFQDPDGRAVFAGGVNGNNRTPQACGRSPTGSDSPSRTVFLDATPQEGSYSNEVTCPEQSLPIDPNGVIYDAQSRAPVPGAIVTLKPEGVCPGYDPALHVIGYNQYATDAQGNPQMTVGPDGFYKFLLAASAPASCSFRLEVTPPPGYSGPSTIIPPAPGLKTPLGVGRLYNVQPQPTAPVGGQATTYHIVFLSGSTHNDIFNNHIPLDPLDPGVLRVSKTGSVRIVELGDTMEYTIGVSKWNGAPLSSVTAIDTLPAGFRYIPGTFRVAGAVQPDPAGGVGPVLNFALPNLVAGATVNFTYRVRVGVGAQEGDGINRVRATGRSGPFTVTSNTAQYKVRVDGGVFTNDACVVGKVYVDCNNNQVQDEEELGIPGVKLYFDDGTFMVSDSEGKYSICGRQPRTYVLKVDPSTLPRGSRLVTTSGRNVGDANSLFVDLKNGILQRADFAEGSCSNTVLEQVKARRTRGEVSAPETERKGSPALIFRSKSAGSPAQATDSANQPFMEPRDRGGAPPPARMLESEQLIPVPQLPQGVAPLLTPPSRAVTPSAK